jgi:hypothetical protein
LGRLNQSNQKAFKTTFLDAFVVLIASKRLKRVYEAFFRACERLLRASQAFSRASNALLSAAKGFLKAL